MAEAIVEDWLQEYNRLEKEELNTFAASHENNHEVSVAVFTILSERSKYPEVVHGICNQLHSFYRSERVILRRFTMQFVPKLVQIYLMAVVQGERKEARSVETLLLTIYNCEIVSDDGQARTISFQMPVLAKPSIYHEEKTLHGSDLKRWEEYANKEVFWGPFPPVESLNAHNRPKVMAALMSMYNQQLSLLQKVGLYHLCKASSQMVTQGFQKSGHAHRASYGSDPTTGSSYGPKFLPRIPLSSKLLLELLHAVYFAMFNEFGTIATQAVEDIHQRARFELYTDVTIVTNAIKNSLAGNPSGQPSDGPMGISIALSPATTSVTMSKSMITNASFRTKKLPDDIPIQAEDGTGGGLASINEDGEPDLSQVPRNTSTRGSKEGHKIHKIPGLGGLRKKDKGEKEQKSGTQMSKNGVPEGQTPIQTQPMSLSKKLLEKKDKLIGKTASLTNDSIDIVEKNSSPLAILKRKSSSIDVTSPLSAPVVTVDNGAEVLSPTYEFGDSFDSEGDNKQTMAALNDAKSQANMQVSQV